MIHERNQKLPDDVLESLTDRYSEVHYISGGGVSSVFSARDNILDKRVAIKVLKHPQQKALVQFQREAKVAGRLHQTNLVTILDFGIAKANNAYLIMETSRFSKR